jgi:hypothetical protein
LLFRRLLAQSVPAGKMAVNFGKNANFHRFSPQKKSGEVSLFPAQVTQ